MDTQPSKSAITQAEIMDTPQEFHIPEPDPEILKSRLDGILCSISTDADDDIHNVSSIEEERDELPAQDFKDLPRKDLLQATKDWADSQDLLQVLPPLPKTELIQATQDWADRKDEAERQAGLKPCCPLCRTDSHTEAQCVAARFRQACKRKSSEGEESKPGKLSIRNRKNFKRFKRDLGQVVVHGKNTDDLQYVRETDSYSHLFACYLVSAFGTFTEGHKPASHCMVRNEEVMGLWAKFSSQGMTKQAAEEHLMMAYERIQSLFTFCVW